MRIVGDNQRVLVEHRPLKTGVGADVFAELLTHDARLQVAEAAVERDPQIGVNARVQGEEIGNKLADGDKVADKADACAQGDGDPQRIFQHALAPLLAAPRFARELELLGAVAFDFLLNPEEHFRINRVRAGVTAPDAAKQSGGKKEQ